MDGDVAAGIASLPDEVAVDNRRSLADVTAEALVIACRGDNVHPVEVAEQLAEVLPKATLHVYDNPGVVWTERADLRNRIAGFLNAV
jgi:pimeloyl-ACP methyl ester carboxylesterase